MLKITAAELFTFAPDGGVVINEGLRRLADAELPASVSFKLARTIRKVSAELETFNKTRMGLFEKLGEKTGDSYRIPAEKMDEFAKELQGLLAVEIELDVKPLKLAELNGCNLRPRDMLDLERFVEDT